MDSPRQRRRLELPAACAGAAGSPPLGCLGWPSPPQLPQLPAACAGAQASPSGWGRPGGGTECLAQAQARQLQLCKQAMLNVASMTSHAARNSLDASVHPGRETQLSSFGPSAGTRVLQRTSLLTPPSPKAGRYTDAICNAARPAFAAPGNAQAPKLPQRLRKTPRSASRSIHGPWLIGHRQGKQSMSR